MRWNLILVFLSVAPLAFAAPDTDKTRTVTVSGDADVLVSPDIVTVTLGIETSSTVLLEAKQENDRRTSAVIEAAQGAGVAPADIKSDFLRIEPRYETISGVQRHFYGYFVQRNVVVELKNVARFEELLSTLLEQGANYVHGIDFRTSELRKHRDNARSLAIKAAREKATALADELDQRIGKPTSINETQSWWRSSYGSSSWGGSGGLTFSNVAQNVSSSAGASGEGVQPGKIRVNAKVDVSFELVDPAAAPPPVLAR